MSRATNNQELAQSGIDTWPNCISKSGKKVLVEKKILTSRATDNIKKWEFAQSGLNCGPIVFAGKKRWAPKKEKTIFLRVVINRHFYLFFSFFGSPPFFYM